MRKHGIAQPLDVPQHVGGGTSTGKNIIFQGQRRHFIFFKNTQGFHRKLKLFTIQRYVPFHLHHLSGGERRAGQAERTPYLGFQRAARVLQLQSPVRAVTGLLKRGQRNDIDGRQFVAGRYGTYLLMFRHEYLGRV